MKTKIIILVFMILFGFSLKTEPITDSIDIIAGATNPSYDSTIDGIAGVSEYDDDEDEDEEEEEDDEDDD